MYEKVKDIAGTALYERLSSPFFQSLIIAWLYFNWDIILYVLTSPTVGEEKVDYIKKTFLENNYDILWGPLLFSFISLSAYIFMSLLAFSLWEYFNIAKQNLRGLIRKLRRTDIAYVEQLQARNTELYEKIQQNKSEFEKRIDALESDINSQKESFEKRIDEGEKEIAEKNQLYEKLLTDKNDLDATIAKYNSEIKSLKKINSDLTKIPNELIDEAKNSLDSKIDPRSLKQLLTSYSDSTKTIQDQDITRISNYAFTRDYLSESKSGSIHLTQEGHRFLELTDQLSPRMYDQLINDLSNQKSLS